MDEYKYDFFKVKVIESQINLNMPLSTLLKNGKKSDDFFAKKSNTFPTRHLLTCLGSTLRKPVQLQCLHNVHGLPSSAHAS